MSYPSVRDQQRRPLSHSFPLLSLYTSVGFTSPRSVLVFISSFTWIPVPCVLPSVAICFHVFTDSFSCFHISRIPLYHVLQSEYRIGSALPTIESPSTRATPFLFARRHASLVNADSASGSETAGKPLVFLVPSPSSRLETLHIPTT
jgi:hypothetical protein